MSSLRNLNNEMLGEDTSPVSSPVPVPSVALPNPTPPAVYQSYNRPSARYPFGYTSLVFLGDIPKYNHTPAVQNFEADSVRVRVNCCICNPKRV